MATPSSLLLFQYLLISYCLWNVLSVSGARELAAYPYRSSQRKAAARNSACKAPAKGLERGFQGLEIVHRHGPCSPLGQGNSSFDHHRILYQDQLRVDSINFIPSNAASFSNNGEGVSLPISGGSIGAGNFVVQVGFGTEPHYLHLILDTGSEMTWIQCQPCSGQCYSQQDNIFNPSDSSTFSKAPCSSPDCTYTMDYFDLSYSSGYMAQDTLTISTFLTFPKFIFGCGQNNSDSFGQAAGVIGLGQGGQLSLLPQTASDFAKIFCYCLPKDDSPSGYLLFGMQALETCQKHHYTPMLTNQDKPHLYFVNLGGITIGQRKVAIPSSIKTIIDSGTVVSRLPPSVYDAVLSQFQESMSIQGTCYEGSLQDTKIPSMVLHFDNVDVNLDPSAVVWRENGDSQVCLAFARNKDESDLTIIGNQQQRSRNVLYNIQERKLEFGGTGDCK